MGIVETGRYDSYNQSSHADDLAVAANLQTR